MWVLRCFSRWCHQPLGLFFFFLKKKTRISEAGSKKVIGMFLRNDHRHSKRRSLPVRPLSKESSPTRNSYSTAVGGIITYRQSFFPKFVRCNYESEVYNCANNWFWMVFGGQIPICLGCDRHFCRQEQIPPPGPGAVGLIRWTRWNRNTSSYLAPVIILWLYSILSL